MGEVAFPARQRVGCLLGLVAPAALVSASNVRAQTVFKDVDTEAELRTALDTITMDFATGLNDGPSIRSTCFFPKVR